MKWKVAGITNWSSDWRALCDEARTSPLPGMCAKGLVVQDLPLPKLNRLKGLVADRVQIIVL